MFCGDNSIIDFELLKICGKLQACSFRTSLDITLSINELCASKYSSYTQLVGQFLKRSHKYFVSIESFK